MTSVLVYFGIGAVYAAYLLAKGRNGLYGRSAAFLMCLIAWPAVMYFEARHRRFMR